MRGNLKENWFKYVMATAAVVLSVGAISSLTRPVTAQSALEARVQTLEDKEAIRQLLVQYGHLLDTHDYIGYSKLFAKDGTWKGGIGSAKGPEGIAEMLKKAFANSPPYDPMKVRSFHLMTNFLITVNGDKASSLSKWTFFSRTPDNKLQPQLSGHYDDTYVREDGVWKFQSRVAPHDIPNP